MSLTRERLLKIKTWRETYGPGSNVVLPADEAEDLARIALASLEAEPVISININDGWPEPNSAAPVVGAERLSNGVHELYTAPPVPVVPEEMPKGLAGQIVSLSEAFVVAALLGQHPLPESAAPPCSTQNL